MPVRAGQRRRCSLAKMGRVGAPRSVSWLASWKALGTASAQGASAASAAGSRQRVRGKRCSWRRSARVATARRAPRAAVRFAPGIATAVHASSIGGLPAWLRPAARAPHACENADDSA
eukprot:352677-Chlamydomonas_euryale.AAC.6